MNVVRMQHRTMWIPVLGWWMLAMSLVDGFVVPTSSRVVVAVIEKHRIPLLFAHETRDAESSTRTFRDDVMTSMITMGLSLTLLLSSSSPVYADGATKEFKFPPVDLSDKTRCILKGGSSMGQANAARDKLYDLRQCKLSNANAAGYDLSGVIMTNTDLSKANLRETYLSKGFLRESNFDGADFSNAIVDRASFSGSTLRGAIFTNAVLTGTSFEGADVSGADFTEAALGYNDVRYLCKNPTLNGENPTTGADTRLSVGCN